MRLHKGSCAIVGRKSPYSLYQQSLATYGAGDVFDQRASEGFIAIYGLPVRVQGKVTKKQ
jgi:argininosuccinate synthase